MLKSYFNRLTAAKLRKAADVLDPPRQARPVPVSALDHRALLELSELGPITEVVTTFDRQGRLFNGLYGQHIIDGPRERSLRGKGLLTGGGVITALGRRAIELGAGDIELHPVEAAA